MNRLPESLPEPIGEAVFISLARRSELNDPEYSDLEKEKLEKLGGFEGYILDSKIIKDPGDIRKYIQTMKDSFGDPESISLCFSPRHALKYPSRFGEVLVKICFQCRSASITIGSWSNTQYITKPVRAEIDKLYEINGVRLPMLVNTRIQVGSGTAK